MDFLRSNACGQVIGKVSSADETPHVTSEFNDQAALLHEQGPVRNAPAGRLHRLLKLLEIRAE